MEEFFPGNILSVQRSKNQARRQLRLVEGHDAQTRHRSPKVGRRVPICSARRRGTRPLNLPIPPPFLNRLTHIPQPLKYPSQKHSFKSHIKSYALKSFCFSLFLGGEEGFLWQNLYLYLQLPFFFFLLEFFSQFYLSYGFIKFCFFFLFVYLLFLLWIIQKKSHNTKRLLHKR